MNKFTTLSLIASAAILMTGCNDSDTKTVVVDPTPTTAPTAAPTAGPTPAPTATPQPEAQPAPVNPVSVQQLLINTPVLQTTNIAMAAVEAATSLVAAQITQNIVVNILNPVSGDLPCAVLGATQGSGSIHGVATTLAAGGNSYTIDFNQCTFDTASTLAATAGVQVEECEVFVEELSTLILTEGPNGHPMIDPDAKLNANSFGDLNTLAEKCAGTYQEAGEPPVVEDMGSKDIAEDLKDALGALVYITAVSDMFEEHIEDLDLGVHASLNDIMTITGSIYSEVNLNPTVPAGNIWTSKFSANNFNMNLTDNAAQITKFDAKMNGDYTGNVNVIPLNVPTVLTRTAHVAGSNNLSSTLMVNSAGINLFVDAGVVGQAAAHAFDASMTIDPTQTGWQRRAHSTFNDSGDGFVKAFLTDHSTAYEGEFSLYNKNFVQERTVVTDPSAIGDIGVARKSTYAANGSYGMNTKGTPFVWNTMGAFTFTTTNAATKTKVAPGGNIWDYQVVSGDVTIAGTMPINFKFLPDLAANPNDNDGFTDGSIVMEVGSDVMTLPANIVSWLEVSPQP